MTNACDIIAFVDESKKPVREPATGRADTSSYFYVATSVVTFDSDIEALRSLLNELSEQLSKPLHYSELSSRQREHALSALCQSPDWEASVFETSKAFHKSTDEHWVRARLLDQMLEEHTKDITHFVLEQRGKPGTDFDALNERDHQVFRRHQRRSNLETQITLEHRDKSEIMLAIPDLISGARTDFLCRRDTLPYTHISHRVSVSPVALS